MAQDRPTPAIGLQLQKIVITASAHLLPQQLIYSHLLYSLHESLLNSTSSYS
jgi:hypothetical protein